MKKYIIILSIIFSFAACQEDFLDEKTVTVLTQDFYKTPEGLEALAKGTYQLFRYQMDFYTGLALFSGANDCEVFLHNDDHRTANGLYRNDAWGPDVTDGNRIGSMVNSLLGGVSGGISEGMYPVINRCNVFIDRYMTLDETTKEETAENYGEVLFMRAYAYYLLTNILGDVPLKLEPTEGMPENFYLPKSSMEEIYKVMISDLRKAVEVLPESVPEEELGRITKPAGAHFLAKIYLHRAQAASFQNSSEEHLKMLYKGNVSTDLDSVVHYATVAIDLKKDAEGTFNGLAPDFADLWEVTENNPANLSVNNPRDLLNEILLSTQYEGTGTYNGRYWEEAPQLMHLYNTDFTVANAGLSRDIMTYPRPFRAIGPNDWTYDMYTDRANDSRYYKSFITSYTSNTESGAESGVAWDAATAYYYNKNLKSQYTGLYPGDSATEGTSKIVYESRSLAFIENSKDEPLDSLWVASQPYVLCARWIACSPNNEGYYDKDGSGNITGFKTGAEVDPSNPIVTNVANRRVRYRVFPSDGLERYGCDLESRLYLSNAKYWDLNRGQGTNDRGGASIDMPLMRLAETYLIRAEAYGRQGDYTSAIADINILRQRASFKPEDTRSDVLVNLETGVMTGDLEIPADEKVAPYTVNTDSYSSIEVTGEEWQAGTEKAVKENYPPINSEGNALTEAERFIHFIYNEKARELLFEQKVTEDLHNAGILWERVYYRDYFGAPTEATGTDEFPFPFDFADAANTQGAIGTGRGQFQKFHTFKPWPTAFLQLLTDEDNNPLSSQAIEEYQNPGY